MKRSSRFLLFSPKMKILLLLFCSFIFSGRFVAQPLPELDTLTIMNGMKIYFLQHERDSLISMKLVISGGKKNENECQTGYSEIVQKMLCASINLFQNSVLNKARPVRGEISNGNTILSINCTVTELNRQIEILSNALARLSFTREKIDPVVSSVTNHYKPENLSAYALSALYRNFVFYGAGNPLGRTYCQYQIEKALPEDLREFYEQHYLPKKASLLICGNFKTGEVKRMISKHFVKWRSFRKESELESAELKSNPIREREITVVNKMDSDTYCMKWVFPAPDLNSVGHIAFSVACNLFKRDLEKRINENFPVGCDSIKLQMLLNTQDLMEITCRAGSYQLRKIIDVFDSTLVNFRRSEYSTEHLDSAKAVLKYNSEKNTGSEFILSFYDPLVYEFSERRNYQRNLSLIKSSHIQHSLERYLLPESYRLIIVGKEHLVAKEIESLKNVSHYSASGFETCDEACRDVVVIRCHCESCWRRGQYKIWQFNPKQKDAIKCAKAKSGMK